MKSPTQKKVRKVEAYAYFNSDGTFVGVTLKPIVEYSAHWDNHMKTYGGSINIPCTITINTK